MYTFVIHGFEFIFFLLIFVIQHNMFLNITDLIMHLKKIFLIPWIFQNIYIYIFKFLLKKKYISSALRKLIFFLQIEHLGSPTLNTQWLCSSLQRKFPERGLEVLDIACILDLLPIKITKKVSILYTNMIVFS